MKPLELTTAQAVVGAVGMSVLSLALEPISPQTFAALLSPAPLAGLLFVVIGGTFIAYTIFLHLMRDWGASRAGLYSFVSPVVALIFGALVYAEPFTWREIDRRRDHAGRRRNRARAASRTPAMSEHDAMTQWCSIF